MAVETGGVLEVGIDDGGNVVVNHPDLKPDTNGVGHIVFSPQQARAMARLLMDKADEAARATWDRGDTAAPTLAKALPPVDRSKRCMLSGAPETPDHRDMLPNGQ